MSVIVLPERRWVDDQGHSWPVTGNWCAVCGLPVISVGSSNTHPCCEATS